MGPNKGHQYHKCKRAYHYEIGCNTDEKVVTLVTPVEQATIVRDDASHMHCAS